MSSAPQADRPLVLVSDDDDDIRALVRIRLERSGYDVVAVSDGEEAVRLALEYGPDLVVLDVNMPGLDGYAACRAIQEGSPVPPPVIFLTANSTTTARIEGLDSGAVDYVVKPFEPAELLARVRSALRTKFVTDRLAVKATSDGLTGLLNRQELDVRVAAAVSLARRHDRPLACLMVDVDHFKAINDGSGHAAGDAVLRELGDRFRAASRDSDVLGRYGGEEFALVLPETDAWRALKAAERLRRVVADTPIRVRLPGGEEDLPVRVSVGVASLEPGMAGPEALYAAADEALYRAKELGRDRVVAQPLP